MYIYKPSFQTYCSKHSKLAAWENNMGNSMSTYANNLGVRVTHLYSYIIYHIIYGHIMTYCICSSWYPFKSSTNYKSISLWTWLKSVFETGTKV